MCVCMCVCVCVCVCIEGREGDKNEQTNKFNRQIKKGANRKGESVFLIECAMLK
jgi:hypothetical protein